MSTYWTSLKEAKTEFTDEPGDWEGPQEPNSQPAIYIGADSDGVIVEGESLPALAAWLRRFADEIDPPHQVQLHALVDRWRANERDAYQRSGWEDTTVAASIEEAEDYGASCTWREAADQLAGELAARPDSATPTELEQTRAQLTKLAAMLARDHGLNRHAILHDAKAGIDLAIEQREQRAGAR